MECRLDQQIPEVSPRVAARIAPLSADDCESYGRFRGQLSLVTMRRRLERGQQCFATWHEGQIVHAGWATTREGWIDYLGCEFPLEAGDVYQFDSYTAPAFRGLGLAAGRVAWMARVFRDAGFRRLLAVVWPENVHAFRPLEKAGYRRCGWLRVLRLGRRRYVIYSRAGGAT